MDVHETDPVPSPPDPSPAGIEYARCEQCGAAVETRQRYCVECGAHRRGVPDPAARHLERTAPDATGLDPAAPAAGGSAAAAATAGATSPSPRGRPATGILVAAMLAVIPVAVGVGVAVGRSSNNDDAALIRELGRRPSQASVTVPATSTSAATTTAAAAAHPRRAAHHQRSGGRGGSTKTPHHRRASSSSAAGVGTGRGIGKPAKAPRHINSAPSASQKHSGAKIVNKLQHTNGTSYLNQLPSQVSVP